MGTGIGSGGAAVIGVYHIQRKKIPTAASRQRNQK